MVTPRLPKAWFVVAALVGIAAGALSYPVWVRGFQIQPSELEMKVVGRGAQSVTLYWQALGKADWRAEEIPLQHPGATQPWHIRIAYLARKNAASKGQEVWLLKVASPEPLDWHNFVPTSGWQVRPSNFGAFRQALAAWGTAPATIDIERRGGTLTLDFERQPEGGIVEVTVNGSTRVVDLYSPEIGVESLVWQPDAARAANGIEVLRTRIGHPGGRFRSLRFAADGSGPVDILSANLDGAPLRRISTDVFATPASYWTAPGMATISAVMSSIAVAGLLLLLALTWSAGMEASRALRRTTGTVSALAISAFWTAVYYPALLSDDSIDMWAQAVIGQPNKWHPIGLTIVMEIIHRLLGGHSMEFQVAVVAFLQGTLLWCAIFAAVSLVISPGRKRLAACFFMAMYYPLWPYTITLWKDVWLAIAWIGLLCSFKPVLTVDSFSWKRVLGAAAFLGCALLSRKNAGLVFLLLATGSILVLFCLGRRTHGRIALISAGAIFCLGTVLDAGVNRLAGALGAGNDLNYYMSWELVGTLHFTEKPLARFEQLQTYHVIGKDKMERALKGYSCAGTSEYLVWGTDPPFDTADLTEDSYTIQDMPLLVLGFPKAWLRHRICAVESLMQFPGREIHEPFWFPVLPNRFGIAGGSRLPSIQAAVQHGVLERAVSRFGPLQLPYRHVLLLIASGFASLLVLAWKWWQRAESLPIMPVYLFGGGLAVLMPYLLLSPGGDWRYLMPAATCWLIGLLGAVAALPRVR